MAGVYNMTGAIQNVIFGTVSGDEPVVRLNLEMRCSSCKKAVPGGVTVSRRYHDSDGFGAELQAFLGRYLCGTCRDRARVGRRRDGRPTAGNAKLE